VAAVLNSPICAHLRHLRTKPAALLCGFFLAIPPSTVSRASSVGNSTKVALPAAGRATPGAALRVEVTSPFGTALPSARGSAPPVSVAAGATVTLALTVQAPVGVVPQVALVGEFKGPGPSLPQRRAIVGDVTTAAGRAKLFPILAAPAAQGDEAVGPAHGENTPPVFWLRLSVPRGQPAGRYHAVVRATGGGRRGEAHVVIEVLPFDLMGPSKQYVYVGQRLWESGSLPAVAVQESGFGMLGIEATGDALWADLAACQAQCLRGPVPYRPTEPEQAARATEVEATRREKQLPPLLWLFPFGQLADAARVGAAGVPSGVILGPHDSLGDASLETVVYPVSAAYPEALRGGKARKTSRAAEWWTWDPAEVTPAQNRLYAGLLLWRAGLSGIYLEEAQEAIVGDPLVTARRWEAIRSGVEDVRYLTTLYTLIRQCKDMDRRHPLPARAEAAVAAALARLTLDSPMRDADAVRRQITTWILRLHGVVT
jgi:hypothetical protein